MVTSTCEYLGLDLRVKSINYSYRFGFTCHIFCNMQVHTLMVQSNPFIADTVGTNNFVLYSEVSLIQGLLVFSSRYGMRNGAVKHNMATLSELSLGVCWQGRLSRG